MVCARAAAVTAVPSSTTNNCRIIREVTPKIAFVSFARRERMLRTLRRSHPRRAEMPHLSLAEKGSGKSHRVDGTEVLAGRDPACGIFLEGDEAKTVSGRHVRFFLDDGKWYVEDAGSRNGTFVGSRKLDAGARHALAVGDVI